MTELQRLIEELCPNGVEWKSIENLFHVKNGYTPSKKNEEFWSNGTIPWFRMEDIRTNGRVLSDSIQHVSESAVKGQLIPKNSLFMSTTATLGEHALVTVPFITNQQITSFSLKDEWSSKVDIKFFFHCFFDFGKWCIENANKNGGLSIIGTKKLKQYQIPIPPLEVQKEIVRILDTFTELTSELTSELTARKKQYNYYRDELLSFGEEVEWKSLGEVSNIYGGLTGKGKADFEDGNALYIPYKNIFNNIEVNFSKLESVKVADSENQHEVKYGDILFTGSSETADEAGMSSAVTKNFKGSVYLNSFSFGLRFNKDIRLLPEFSKYLFRSHFMRLEISKTASGVTRFNISKSRFGKIKIPFPSLSEQKRIVDILDRFDALCNDLSRGLPAEIEARKKQYEYYRDKLLDFKELKNE